MHTPLKEQIHSIWWKRLYVPESMSVDIGKKIALPSQVSHICLVIAIVLA